MQLVTYFHACCFSPVKSTFKKAITKGFLKTFPGLTPQLVDKYLPPSVATAKGHLNQERQHLQSTKVTTPKNLHLIDDLCVKTQSLKIGNVVIVHNNELDDAFPLPLTPNTKTNVVAYTIINHTDMSAGYFDLTGRFPQKSSRGNEYIIVGYHYDGNYIKLQSLKIEWHKQSHKHGSNYTTNFNNQAMHQKFTS